MEGPPGSNTTICQKPMGFCTFLHACARACRHMLTHVHLCMHLPRAGRHLPRAGRHLSSTSRLFGAVFGCFLLLLAAILLLFLLLFCVLAAFCAVFCCFWLPKTHGLQNSLIRGDLLSKMITKGGASLHACTRVACTI